MPPGSPTGAEPLSLDLHDAALREHPMNIADARKLFPGIREQVYLNVSLKGLMSTASREAVLSHQERRFMGLTADNPCES